MCGVRGQSARNPVYITKSSIMAPLQEQGLQMGQETEAWPAMEIGAKKRKIAHKIVMAKLHSAQVIIRHEAGKILLKVSLRTWRF